MGRPALLCHLKKGEMIDTQVGFVDTFNWMVDYINNLRGDGDNIEVRNPNGTNPVVRFVADIPEGGGGSIDLTAVDVESGSETTVEGVKTLRLESATDSHVTLNLTDDGEGNATLTIGVEYVDDSNSSSGS